MNSIDEHISTLIELGLSPSQAKIYITLAKSNILNAHSIHTLSGIPRPDVYRILEELEQTGLVEKIISHPETFHPIPIEECLSSLLQKRIDKTQRLQKEALELTRTLQGKTELQESSEKLGFILIKGKEAAYAKAEKMIKISQESICLLMLTRGVLAWLSNSLPTLQEALARNVDCKMIIPKPKEELWEPLKSLGKYPNFSLKLILKQPKTTFSIWDRKTVIISTSTIDKPTLAPILWSDNESMINLCKENFESLWLKAEKADFSG